MTNRPLVSVLMPVFNAEKYLNFSIDSILRQDYENFELILINDGSTDRSFDILQQYARLDKRIRLISQANKGIAKSRNVGISNSKGDFIAWMDADDISLVNRLSKQLKFLEDNKLDLCGASVRCFEGASNLWHYPKNPSRCRIGLIFDSVVAQPVMFGKASLFRELNYLTEFICAEDYNLLHRAVVAGYKIGNCDEVLLRYRVHPESVSHKKTHLMHELANKVRLMHFKYCFPSVNDQNIIDFISCVNGKSKTTAKSIENIFSLLFEGSPADTHEILSQNLFRVLCKTASFDNQVTKSWSNLSSSYEFGCGVKLRWLVLKFLSFFRLSSDSNSYMILRNFFLGVLK